MRLVDSTFFKFGSLVLAGLLAPGAFAAEPTREEQVRAELERQLRDMVPESPSEVQVLFAGFKPEDGYRLVETDFLLDGEPLAVPGLEELNAPGVHRLANLKVEPGEHTLVSRVTYTNGSWSLFSETNGFLWKITASVGFQTQRGLRVVVKASPSVVPNAPDPRLKLKLTHAVTAEMIQPLKDEPAVVTAPPVKPAPGDAGAPVKVAQPTPPPDAGVKPTTTVVSVTPPVERPPVAASRLRLQVTSKKPTSATAFVRGPGEPLKLTVPGKKPQDVPLSAGAYTVDLIADGFLAQTRQVVLAAGADTSVAFALVPAPKAAKAAKVQEGRIELPQPLSFDEKKPVPAKASLSGLALAVDLLVRDPKARLRIEGHTDAREVPEPARQSLSDARARAVADMLIRAGVAPSRVEAVGLGDRSPKAPNLIPRGRELNRRVELVLVRP
ncbi:OmpA domain-containing protein [Corallococcus coralloides]|uniref:OmpA domain-containing protein n=1 Tax=Corallococcus coralloides TaxID=184914 RepID=A0A410RUI4_CORCK|nr:OmpA family protein [Corallococcus coralloides]QAT85548.1 OmpA domain-containing protein [Corallococcus coralloides]